MSECHILRERGGRAGWGLRGVVFFCGGGTHLLTGSERFDHRQRTPFVALESHFRWRVREGLAGGLCLRSHMSRRFGGVMCIRSSFNGKFCGPVY